MKWHRHELLENSGILAFWHTKSIYNSILLSGSSLLIINKLLQPPFCCLSYLLGILNLWNLYETPIPNLCHALFLNNSDKTNHCRLVLDCENSLQPTRREFMVINLGQGNVFVLLYYFHKEWFLRESLIFYWGTTHYTDCDYSVSCFSLTAWITLSLKQNQAWIREQHRNRQKRHFPLLHWNIEPGRETPCHKQTLHFV